MRSPSLSVIVVGRSGIDEILPVLNCLAHQTLAAELEVVVVSTSGGVSPSDLEVFPFASSRIVELERITSRGRAAGHALGVVTSPFVALQENHSFPEPDVFETLLANWSEGDAAASPLVRSANPARLRSLAMYLVSYGSVMARGLDRPVDGLPHHAAVFDRRALEATGFSPETIFHDEAMLHRTLRQLGYHLRIRSAAVAWHINETRWRRVVGDPVILARRFGATRAGDWTTLRRLAYAAGFPLVCVIRAYQLLRAAGRVEDLRGRRWVVGPLLGFIAVASAGAEAWGTLERNFEPPEDFETHEFHIRGRLAGISPSRGGVAGYIEGLPEQLP